MKRSFNRRDLLRLAVALPAATVFGRYQALAAPYKNKLKITAVKAMQINNANCLIRIDTDAGLVGLGEAGASGPMARERIDRMKRGLIGQDPLSIERHFHAMTTMMHPHMAHIPTISGIDIALWDLAGKITGLPVHVLLGGPFRDSVRLYSHGRNVDPLDPASCRDWAQWFRQQPEGFDAFKVGVVRGVGIPEASFATTLDDRQVRLIARGYANLREAVGPDIDIAAHYHNQFDTFSAIAVAKAVEPIHPLFLEDLLNPPFSEGWMALRRATRVPLLTGEKLELVRGFKPFLDNQAVDIIHPDLAFAGGFTGVKKIADYAALTRTPVALHNVGTLVLTCASAQFGASIQNFYRSESPLGWPGREVEKMAAGNPPQVKNSLLKVSTEPGLGVDLDPDYLRQHLAPGEEYWG